MALKLTDILVPGGAVAQAMGAAFEARPQQVEMCEAVAKVMHSRSHLLVEAGTGVGKSFAYLLPAALRCVLYGETVVVSTHTISLQEQIIEKDLPIIERVLEILRSAGAVPEPATPDGKARPLKSVLVKGRGNYVSIRRLVLASERQDRLFGDPAARRSLHVVEDWAKATLDGTLSTLPPLERPGIWDKVQSDTGNCMGRKCPQYERCFYQNARREMEGANLLVCNHAVFFSDLSLRAQDVGFMPRYDHVVLDEAHTVEEVAGEHFGVSLSEGRVNHLLTNLYQPRSGKGYLAQLALHTGETSSVERAIGLVHRAQGAARVFFEHAAQLAPGEESGPSGRASDKTWLDNGARTVSGGGEPRTTRLRRAGAVDNTLSPAMAELALRLRALREIALVEADRFELNAYAQRADMIAADAKVLVDQALPACAYWVEMSGVRDDAAAGSALAGSRRVTLACGPVEVAPILKDRLFSHDHSVVLTSATLATAGAARPAARSVPSANADSQDTIPQPADLPHPAFAHAVKQLGCAGAQTLQLGSPFDYATQVEVFVESPGRAPSDPPDPPRHRRKSAGDNSAASLAAAILRHVDATEGGAFVLFTSFWSLNGVARELEAPLEQRRMPLLVQGRDGSRTAILQRFRENDRSVLLGAASFWQGVDVRGRGLRNVIITKLPFDPPDRPLVQARCELIESRGGNAFMEDSLPRAVLRFKQGFGRLIRSADDHGRVVILDPRVVTSRYGRAFLNALPTGVPVRLQAGKQDE